MRGSRLVVVSTPFLFHLPIPSPFIVLPGPILILMQFLFSLFHLSFFLFFTWTIIDLPFSVSHYNNSNSHSIWST